MSFLLDTDICSAFIKHRRGMAHRFIQHSGRLNIAAITLGELYTWAFRRPDPTPTLTAIENQLLPEVKVLVFDHRCAHEFGKVRGALLNLGRPTNAVDLQIAAPALVHDLTVITHNSRDYENIAGLRLAAWLVP